MDIGKVVVSTGNWDKGTLDELKQVDLMQNILIDTNQQALSDDEELLELVKLISLS